MAVPKKKTSKAKKNMRRSHHALSGVTLSTCSNCNEPKRPHRVCPSCGYYAGRAVLVEETAE